MDREQNVSNPERWVSVIAGSALAAYALKQRSLKSLFLGSLGGMLVWRGATGYCDVYGALGLSTADGYGRKVSIPYGRGIRVEQAVTINRPAAELYRFWRNFENLPRFMEHLESVTVIDQKRSHWKAKGPAGVDAEWDAEIINEIPNELIGWRSVEGSRVDNAGSVHFESLPRDRGTEVRVILRYDPPAGRLGAAFAKIFREEPKMQIREDLRRFKQLVEAGEVAVA